MPISAKEKEKVRQHQAKETIEKDMIYFTPGHFRIAGTIRSGARIFSKNAKYLFLGIPDALAVSLTLYLIAYFAGFASPGTAGAYGQIRITSVLEVLLAFFIYFTIVSAPLSNLYKSKVSGIRYCGTVKAIACSLSILQPIGYVAFLISIILLTKVSAISWLTISMTLIAFILYLISINQSLLPNFLADTKNNRSNALSLGWLLLSNNSVNLFTSNILIFSPVIAFTSLFVITQNPVFLFAEFVVFLMSEGTWYGATSSIHRDVSKGKNSYNIA